LAIPPGPVRFANTTIAFASESPLDRLSEALYTAINARGIMASGLPGAIRLAAGPDVEREIRAQANLLVGRAYLVGPGTLARRGVRHIACGVTTPQPGLPPRRAPVEEAFASGLQLLHDASARSLTLPEVGIRIPNIAIPDAAGILTEHLAGALRRGFRPDTVTIAGLHPEYLRACYEQLLANGATRE
jgi:O-acetyl-ADP-ribose deacetylase (regulator of RNase III)